MRRLPLILITGLLAAITLLAVILPTQAQTEFTCDNEAIIQNPLRLHIPEPDFGADYAISALGIGDFLPVIGYDELEDIYLCDEGGADEYTVTLPTTGFVPESGLNTQWVYAGEEQIDLLVGEFNSRPGEMVLLVEILRSEETTHEIQLDITDAMHASGVPITAYLVGIEDETNPSLQLLDAEGAVIDQCDDVEAACPDGVDLTSSTINYFGGTIVADNTDAMLTIGLDDAGVGEQITLQINTAEPGDVILAVHLGSGEAVSDERPATLETDEDSGNILLSCDGDLVTERGILLGLPDTAASLQIISIGEGEPVAAQLDTEGSGRCIFAEASVTGFDALLPTIDETQTLLTGIRVSSAGGDWVIGGRGEQPEQYLIIVEADAITADDPQDRYALTLTESLLNVGQDLSIYMIALDELNPLLTLVDADDEPMNLPDATDEPVTVRCDDAGFAETCWGAGAFLGDVVITLANGDSLNGTGVDAMLTLPTDAFSVGDTLHWLAQASDVDEPISEGGYVLILQFALE